MAFLDDAVAGQDVASYTDMMKILVATDNHVGYMEKDPVRFNDSLESFEEVLKKAKSNDVDFILLGGDLFHDNKPSRQILYRSMELFRHYCMGDRPCPIEYCSNPTIDFHHSKFQGVNYDDPNFNISIPVFSIHGNHDDPVGVGNLSVVDILHVSNLINYFGKVDNIEKIEVSPVLLQKGRTKLALYGLGSCRDERLHRMFHKGNVKFLRPSEDQSVWFNVLILHQNRAKHGATNYIPPSFLPDFFDLVIWGHEHECRIEPEFIPTGGENDDGDEKGLYISQPGSSVATSLSDGEQKPKHCGILYIKHDCTFKMVPVKLETVRPFLLESVSLADTGIHPQDNEKVESYLTEKVTHLIERAKKNSENDKLPIVRLKVDYHGGYSTFSLARFGQKFLDKAANPKNLLAWHCRRDNQAVKKNCSDGSSTAEDRVVAGAHISEYLEEEVSKEKIQLLSDKNMAEALFEYVEKMENDSIATCVKYSLQASQNLLKSKHVREDDITTHMEKERAEFFRVQETEGMSAVREELATSRESRPDPPLHDSSSGEDQAFPVEESDKRRGRGRGSTRGSRGRGVSRGRLSKGVSTKSQASQGVKKKSGSGACGTSHYYPPVSPAPLTGITSSSKSGREGSKRSLVYLNSGSEDDVFQNKTKIKKVAESDMIDLTQDYAEIMELSSRTQASLKPVRSSKRSKK